LLFVEETQSSSNDSDTDSDRVEELESKVKEMEEKVQQLQSQLDEVRTERDKLEQAQAEMEAEREEEIKIIERVITWLYFLMNCTLIANKLNHRICALQKVKHVRRNAGLLILDRVTPWMMD
jgi:predicted  nucleic acid-binding Zn-ribbon protein